MTFTAPKPPPEGYPRDPDSLGTRLRKARMDRDLLQREVAAKLGVHLDTVKNWENGRTEPSLKAVPKILKFLDSLTPETAELAENFPVWLTLARRQRGLSQRGLADRLEVDESTVIGWEKGRHRPTRQHRERLERLLTALLSPNAG